MADIRTIPFEFEKPLEFYSGFHKSLLYLEIKGNFSVEIFVPEFYPSQKHYYPLIMNDFKSALESSMTMISENRDIRKLLADKNIFKEVAAYARVCLEQWNEEYGMNVYEILPTYVSFDDESIMVMRIAEEISSRMQMQNNQQPPLPPQPVSEKACDNNSQTEFSIYKEVQKPLPKVSPIIHTQTNNENETENNEKISVPMIKNTWKCVQCGCINDSKFCKDCGLKRQSWRCVCGQENTGLFCTICRTSRDKVWECECGSLNKSKFCPDCGKSKPEHQNGGE